MSNMRRDELDVRERRESSLGLALSGWSRLRDERCPMDVSRLSRIHCIVGLAFSAVFVLWGFDAVSAARVDFSAYTSAIEYCRGDVARPMALSADKRILCFDGVV